MSFQRKSLKTEVYQRAFPRKRNAKKFFKLPKIQFENAAKIWVYFILLSTFLTCAFGVLIYVKYIKPLPSIKELENINIAESSTIFDSEWNELYKVYKEKRTYVALSSISENMRHAIVAWEDKTFFQNGGIDFKRMAWAFVYYIIWKTDKVEGTSTISQQLIRNTLIGSERKLERKVKEMYLSYKLNTWISKEKILELYLNKIFFWHNSYWIEEASHTFFGKTAKEIWVLEASILASLPKGPTYYSPYNHPDRLLWYPYVYDPTKKPSTSEEEIPNDKIIDKKDMETYKDILWLFTSDIESLSWKRLSNNSILLCWVKKEHFKSNIWVDKDGCVVKEYSKLLNFLNEIRISSDNQALEYQTWRKDFILWRMLEDEYITFEDYKKSIVTSIGYKFNEYKENIKYPYFVFYVKDYIEKKYGSWLLEQAWLKIYTTINPKYQDKAEQLVLDYSTKYQKSINANNAALVSIDNKNWQIVSMVGGRDYFDIENKWNVNIITSYLQPWSSFKPFVYALAMDRKQIGTKTPIYDIQTNFWNYTPKNFDGKFYGKMNVSTALNNSRNIPAIKMFFYAGQEKPIKEMMKSFWVLWLNEKEWYYGPPMALGTVELRPIDLAWAYSVFANLGLKKEVTPILKIIDGKWNVIEDNTIKENKGTRVFDEGSSYLISSILSDTSSRPDGWNKYLSLPDRLVAAKTGTSTKQYKKASGEKVILPRNLWTAWYTPQFTTVVWVGNTDGAEVSLKWDGLQSAWPIWRDFMNFIHKWKPAERWKMPSNIKSVNVSEISGFLTPEWFPQEFWTWSLFRNIPRSVDDNFVKKKVDILCNGEITDKTPKSAIKEIFWVRFRSFESDYWWWENVNNWYVNWGGCGTVFWTWSTYTCWVDFKKETCSRTDENPTIEIFSNIKSGSEFINGSNYIEFGYSSKNPIKQVDILIWENKISEIPLEGISDGNYKGSFFIPEWYYWDYNITLEAIDSQYYSWTEIKAITISQKDTLPPQIEMVNPKESTSTIWVWESLTVEWNITEQSPVKSVNIYLNGNPIKLWLTERHFSYTLNADKNLTAWTYKVKIEVVDNTFNTSEKVFDLIIKDSPSEN